MAAISVIYTLVVFLGLATEIVVVTVLFIFYDDLKKGKASLARVLAIILAVCMVYALVSVALLKAWSS